MLLTSGFGSTALSSLEMIFFENQSRDEFQHFVSRVVQACERAIIPQLPEMECSQYSRLRALLETPLGLDFSARIGVFREKLAGATHNGKSPRNGVLSFNRRRREVIDAPGEMRNQ